MHTAIIYFDVEDKEYFKRLEDYIRLNFPRFFRICSDGEDRDFVITDYLNKRNSKSIITIKDTEADIDKFQRASDICIELIRIIYKDIDISNEHRRNSPAVVCVTSALGGAGKTKISKALAGHASGMGRQVLYINLDPSSSGETKVYEKSGNGLSKLHYSLEKKQTKSVTLLKEAAEAAAGAPYDCIVNINPAPDCVIGSDSAEKLLEAAFSDEFHDLIILDVPSFLSDTLIRLMQGSSGGVIITGKDMTKREKGFIDCISAHCGDKVIIVKNRCKDVENSIPMDDRIKPGEQFNKAISHLYRSMEV